jgi:hypothetical protein
VTGGPPLVNTATTELSFLIGERAIESLPLNGRNYVDNLIAFACRVPEEFSDGVPPSASPVHVRVRPRRVNCRRMFRPSLGAVRTNGLSARCRLGAGIRHLTFSAFTADAVDRIGRSRP